MNRFTPLSLSRRALGLQWGQWSCRQLLPSLRSAPRTGDSDVHRRVSGLLVQGPDLFDRPRGLLGQDSEGRLLVSSGQIYRTKAPLKVEDERALVLKGPGCDTRHSFVPDLKNDDSVSVTFENKTGLHVILRQLDNQLRWHRLKELDEGEKVVIKSLSNNASKQNVRLMVSDPADETCLGVYVVPMAKESTIVATKP